MWKMMHDDCDENNDNDFVIRIMVTIVMMMKFIIR